MHVQVQEKRQQPTQTGRWRRCARVQEHEEIALKDVAKVDRRLMHESEPAVGDARTYFGGEEIGHPVAWAGH